MDTMNDELWRVQLSTGEIRTMTLEALDQAFEDGLIDARVPVLPPGASAWTTLGQAAGLEDDASIEETPSLSPIAISTSAPSSAAVRSAPEAKPELDLDLPDSFDELQPRRGRGLVIGGAIGALALAAVVAVIAGNLAESAPVAADVKAAAAVAVEAPPAAVETLPPPVAKEADKPKEAEKPKDDAKPELSDWQKRMLADADKAREEKARVKTQERTEKAAQPKPQPQKAGPTRSNGLLNGGDKFDPLNGAL